MLEHVFAEIVNQAIQQAAQDTGIELGRELKNFLKVSRGEAEWDDLTHVQQTMFLGGDRDAYERIRQSCRGAISRSSRDVKCRGSNGHIPRGPFYDYSDF